MNENKDVEAYINEGKIALVREAIEQRLTASLSGGLPDTVMNELLKDIHSIYTQ